VLIEQGKGIGLEEGREREISILTRQLKRKIGSLSSHVERRVAMLSFDELELLGEALFDFNTDADLDRWLQKIDH